MGIVLGILVGLVVGAIAVYLWQQKIVTQQAEAIQQSRRQLDQLEQQHEQRLRQATEQLRQDYDARIAALSAPSAAAPPAPAEVSPPLATVEPAPVVPPEPPTESPKPVPVAAPVEDKPNQGSEAAIAAPAPHTTTQAEKKGLKPRDEVSLSALTLDSRQTDPALRRQVAVSLQAITRHGPAPAIQRSLPLLKQLSQDSDPNVRLEAITAVAELTSPKALPILRRALRDSDSSVVALASGALTKFKGYRTPVPIAAKPKLPKNR